MHFLCDAGSDSCFSKLVSKNPQTSIGCLHTIWYGVRTATMYLAGRAMGKWLSSV